MAQPSPSLDFRFCSNITPALTFPFLCFSVTKILIKAWFSLTCFFSSHLTSLVTAQGKVGLGGYPCAHWLEVSPQWTWMSLMQNELPNLQRCPILENALIQYTKTETRISYEGERAWYLDISGKWDWWIQISLPNRDSAKPREFFFSKQKTRVRIVMDSLNKCLIHSIFSFMFNKCTFSKSLFRSCWMQLLPAQCKPEVLTLVKFWFSFYSWWFVF